STVQGDTSGGPDQSSDTDGQPSDLESLIQQYAKEYGADPSDKSQRSWLKRMADKELYIQRLKAGQNGAQATDSTTGPELLTAFRKRPPRPRTPPQPGAYPAAAPSYAAGATNRAPSSRRRSRLWRYRRCVEDPGRQPQGHERSLGR